MRCRQCAVGRTISVYVKHELSNMASKRPFMMKQCLCEKIIGNTLISGFAEVS